MHYHAMTKQNVTQQSGLNDDASLHPPLMITVCGEYGAGANEVGKQLADKLNVPFTDQRALDTKVKELMNKEGQQTSRHEALFADQQKMIASLFKNYEKDNHRKEMVYFIKAVMDVSRFGGVLSGRGCHIILSNQKVFRIRIEGGPEYCARRVAEMEWIDQATALKIIKRLNKEQVQCVREIYQMLPLEHAYYDLVLNAELFSPKEMVNITLYAMQKSGYSIPIYNAA